MKTCKLFLPFAALCVAFFALTGCTTVEKEAQKAAAALTEFEKLGVTEISVTGKFSHTDYTVKHFDGVRRAEINHSNAWVPQIKIVRETPDKTTP